MPEDRDQSHRSKSCGHVVRDFSHLPQPPAMPKAVKVEPVEANVPKSGAGDVHDQKPPPVERRAEPVRVESELGSERPTPAAGVGAASEAERHATVRALLQTTNILLRGKSSADLTE